MLVADRFMVSGPASAIDLATGETVTLVIARALAAEAEQRWAVRCDFFLRLRHRAIAALVDFGALGATEHFEAWRCAGRWQGAPAVSTRAAELGRVFLEACGRTAPPSAAITTWRGRAVLLPDADTGYEAPSDLAVTGITSLDACGITLIARRAVGAVTELLSDRRGMAPLVLAVEAAPAAGIGVLVNDLARAARVQGFVPLALAQALRPHADLEGRSLFLIARQESDEPWPTLAGWTARSPRPHVLLLTRPGPAAGATRLTIEPIGSTALAAAVRPCALPAGLVDRIQRAAKQAKGLPARFASLLWGEDQPLTSALAVSKAAEAPSTYLADPDAGGTTRQTLVPGRGVPEDLATAEGRLARATNQIRAGRHAPGERGLRQAIAALARRQAWALAARGALELSAFLLRRGRVQSADASLADARQYAANAGRGGPALDLVVATGRVAFAAGRLDEAEAALQASVAAATGEGDSGRAAAARLELARYQFWRGHYREAGETLAALGRADSGSGLAIRADALASGVALGLRDVARAVSQAGLAVEQATRAGDPHLLSIAACAGARAHLCLEDGPAVERDVVTAVQAARRAHDPLRALDARLVGAEADRRLGRRAPVESLLTRVARLLPSALPAVLRARCRLLSDLAADRSPRDAVTRHIEATGLGALELFAPWTVSTEERALREGVAHVLDILHVCQAEAEEEAVLREVCVKLRAQLAATGAAFFGRTGKGVRLLAADGNRAACGTSMADRVMAAAQFVPPHQPVDAVEAGAPVRYAGELLGALVVRWPIGTPPDLPRATLVLTTAAAAAGPAVAALLARRPDAAAWTDFVGVSRGIVELRQAIEQAAAAPFAVLVSGESGSGKELVARALHRRGPRRDRPFRTLNCAALPDDLVESELFGHARGAFTGAVADRLGVFEEAHTGTLFLDEVGELSLRAQAKLLRTLQEGEIRRVGENVSRRIDVRIVSATNRDLPGDVAAGRFRLDLLYRLDVLRISLPPLRDRGEDLPLMVQHAWQEAASRVGSRAVLSSKTVAALCTYSWPGNVRELQNVLAALAVRCPKRGVIAPTALPPQVGSGPGGESLRLMEARRTFEERFVRAALVRTGGHRSRAAAELGVSRQGLSKLMTRLRIVERAPSR